MLDEHQGPPRMPTGVPGLDRVLCGGLLEGDLYLVTGPTGAGKTTLASQLCFEAARERRAVYTTVLAETHERLLRHLRGLDFYDPGAVGDRVYYLSGYKTLADEGPDALVRLLQSEIRERDAALLVVDSLSAVSAVIETDLAIKKLVYDLQAVGGLLGCTTVLVTETAGRPLPEAPVVDGILELAHDDHGLRATRRVHVRKLRGGRHLSGWHPMTIDGRGVRVHVRLEQLPPPDATREAPRGRASTGIAELDAMLAGGLAIGSSALVLGGIGTGKTLLGSQFLAAGADRGERGLFMGFNETPARLLLETAEVVPGFQRHVRDTKIAVLWQAPVEHDIDEVLAEMLGRVRASNARRVVIDGLGGIRLGVMALPQRAGLVLTAVLNELRARDVTCLLTDQPLATSPAEIPELDLPHEAISASTDTVLLLENVVARAETRRIVSVVKQRGSSHDRRKRELTIDARGIHVAVDGQSALQLLGDAGGSTAAARARSAGGGG